eukprot:CAMPEP_0179070324 /NCGR_PEP_ID=MMETSP0796-20121207/30959_1 /TAXON_ID=73915 /ORGANISM="Pyrodinium bahamense, Strain pbaha01" /LENGTH=435 /DNA_ID=CAMNT_0020767407 /DNA_START=9 /DNA_END=1314 /DNA_ORIENTATION=-
MHCDAADDPTPGLQPLDTLISMSTRGRALTCVMIEYKAPTRASIPPGHRLHTPSAALAVLPARRIQAGALLRAAVDWGPSLGSPSWRAGGATAAAPALGTAGSHSAAGGFAGALGAPAANAQFLEGAPDAKRSLLQLEDLRMYPLHCLLQLQRALTPRERLLKQLLVMMPLPADTADVCVSRLSAPSPVPTQASAVNVAPVWGGEPLLAVGSAGPGCPMLLLAAAGEAAAKPAMPSADASHPVPLRAGGGQQPGPVLTGGGGGLAAQRAAKPPGGQSASPRDPLKKPVGGPSECPQGSSPAVGSASLKDEQRTGEVSATAASQQATECTHRGPQRHSLGTKMHQTSAGAWPASVLYPSKANCRQTPCTNGSSPRALAAPPAATSADLCRLVGRLWANRGTAGGARNRAPAARLMRPTTPRPAGGGRRAAAHRAKP